MVCDAFRRTHGRSLFFVDAVQLVLRLRGRAQPHRSYGAHAFAGCAAERPYSFIPANRFAGSKRRSTSSFCGRARGHRADLYFASLEHDL